MRKISERRNTMTTRLILLIAAFACASPAAAATYACQFKGQPLILIDTTYEKQKLTIGSDSAKFSIGNGFWTAEINDHEYIFKFAPRGPDDEKIKVTLLSGERDIETICVRRSSGDD
jgi:hypothetical protein